MLSSVVAEPSLTTRQPVEDLTGDWTLTVDGKTITTPLRSWRDLGITNIASPVLYSKEFTLNAKPAGKRLLLECGRVRDYAKVRLNGVELPARGWQPYRWDVTDALKAGRNVLEIEVRSTPAGRGPAPVPANPTSATSAPAAPRRASAIPTVSGLLGPVGIVASN